jgi:tyrosinase
MQSKSSCSRVRCSILDLQVEFEQGKPERLNKLMRAWKGIKELDPSDPNSFFRLGGYHGLPFKGAGWSNAAFWGGYCNHGNVLFPTWHRAYLYNLEEALRSIAGCEDVTLPYWDETDEYTLNYGLPWVFTKPTFILDGEEIDNPLCSYKIPLKLYDSIPADSNMYTKPKGYSTIRYPYSGLVGTSEASNLSNKHNEKWTYDQSVELLNENLKAWLKKQVLKEYKACLQAPNYTVFSNTTSTQEYNALSDGERPMIPLESPHNHIHLAIGGFHEPGAKERKKEGREKTPQIINGASGDMGENDTAAFDPVFYFHHCNIDRVFWIWQLKHKQTDPVSQESLELIQYYPGTNSSDDQGPTPGITPNSWLTLDTPLDPFKTIGVDGKMRTFTSRDVINIKTQLLYDYTEGSLQKEALSAPLMKANFAQKGKFAKLRATNINKAGVRGSFVVEAYMPNPKKNEGNDEPENIFLGAKSILSRWNLTNCANCQQHLEVHADFDVSEHDIPKDVKPFFNIISHFGDTADAKLYGATELIDLPHPLGNKNFQDVQKVKNAIEYEFM